MNATYCAILMFAAMGIVAEAQIEDNKLFHVHKDGKVGFIDNTGKVVIPINYSRNSGEFSEGLAAVETTDKGWQYIDETGHTKFVLGFDCFPRPFHDGMASVEYTGQLFGYIDNQGHQVIKPQFVLADDFAQGIGLAEKRNVGNVFLDKKGNVLFPQYSPQSFQYFSEGLAPVWIASKVTNGRLTGYIDLAGKLVIPCEYDYGLQCKEGVVMVGKNGVAIGLDTNGEVVIKGNFQQLRSFSEGLAAGRIGGKWGFIDHQGKVIIDPKYDRAFEFSESLACVQISGKWGFVDKSGIMIIEPKFNIVNAANAKFLGGLAAIRDGTKEGYIDKAGALIWPPSE